MRYVYDIAIIPIKPDNNIIFLLSRMSVVLTVNISLINPELVSFACFTLIPSQTRIELILSISRCSNMQTSQSTPKLVSKVEA